MTEFKNRIREYFPLALILLLQVGLRLLLSHWDFYMDDACITFRYSQNIIVGRGFVYNPGEHVLGTTTPLFALFLCLPMLFGTDVLHASRIITITLDAINLILLFHILRKLSKSGVAVLSGVLFYAISPHFTIIIMRGMEYSLVSFLVLISLWGAINGKRIIVGIAIGLCLICRMDLGLFIGVFLLGILWINKRFPIKEIIFAILILLPWIIFATMYFGTPFPSTMAAKLGTLYENINPVIALNTACYTFGFFPFPLILYLVVIIIGILGFYKVKIAMIMLLWGILHVLFNLFFSPYFFIWYYLPAIIPFSLFWTFGWDTIATYSDKLIKAVALRNIVTGLLIVITLLCALPEWFSNFNERIKTWVGEFDWGKTTSIWIRNNIPSSVVICTGTPGFLGVFVKNKILDTGALISPEVLSLKIRRSWEEGDKLVIRRYRPDIIYPFNASIAAELGYIPIKRFKINVMKKALDTSRLDTIYANPDSIRLKNVFERLAAGDRNFLEESINTSFSF